MNSWQRVTAAHSLLSSLPPPQDTVVNAQVKTRFHGTEELATEEPRVRDYFIAHVYGSQLWDSKIGWMLPSGSSPLLSAFLSAEAIHNSLAAQVLTWAVHLCECQDWRKFWLKPGGNALWPFSLFTTSPPLPGSSLFLSAPKRCSLPYNSQWRLGLSSVPLSASQQYLVSRWLTQLYVTILENRTMSILFSSFSQCLVHSRYSVNMNR